jgi:sulfoquinovosyltransferase
MNSSLSINSSLSLPFLSHHSTTHFSSCSCSYSFNFNSLTSIRFRTFEAQPILPFCKKTPFFSLERLNSERRRKSLKLEATKMTIDEESLLNVREDEECPPDSVVNENNPRPRRIALFVEPSPFS